MRILLVEDDDLLVEILTKSLTARKYSVDTVGDGNQAWEYLSTIDYDLIILDVLLPHLDGVSLCRRLRAQKDDTPILILTAQNHSQAKIRGLDAGADDYLVKPFDIEELMARIRALLRRRGGDLFPVLQFEGVLLDPAQCTASYTGLPLTLSTKEYALLELFLHNPQHVFSIDEIVDSLWSSDEYPAEATVRSHIRRLRNRLTDAGAPKDFIANVHGRGYFLKIQAEQAISRHSNVIDERQVSLQRTTQPTVETQYQYFLEDTWHQFQPKASRYLDTLTQAVEQLQNQPLSHDSTQTAHLLSHRLAGTLGLFQQETAMKSAQVLELVFETLSQNKFYGDHPGLRSLLGASNNTPVHQTLQMHLDQIQTAFSALSSPRSFAKSFTPSASVPCLIVLDQWPEWTQSLQVASKNFSLSLIPIKQITELSQLCHDSTLYPNGLIVPIPHISVESRSLQSQLSDVISEHVPSIMIGVGEQINLDTRLAAIRAGMTYIVERGQSPQILLQQILKFIQPSPTQTRALLIDDDEIWLQAMTRQLTSFGFQVTSLTNVVHIWTTLEKSQPDVVLLDCKMPQVSGVELCQLLRSHPDWQSIPIIFLSAFTDAVTQANSLAAGADGFLSKQLHINTIVHRILNRLSRYSNEIHQPPYPQTLESSAL